MNHSSRLELPSDATLVAFLDGELSSADSARIEALRDREPRVAGRLAFLQQGCLGLPEGFAPLLDAAPMAQLHAMLGNLPQATPAMPAPWTRRRLLGGAATCLLAGILGDRLWRGWQGSRWVADGSWRGAVAQYMALYTAQTLEGMDETATAQARQLARVGAQLNLTLTPERVRLPGAELRRAQVLRYDADLIAQLVYQDLEGGPLALCFVRSQQPVQAPAFEVREGLNVLYWANGEHAWMLAGRQPMQVLQTQWGGLAAANA